MAANLVDPLSGKTPIYDQLMHNKLWGDIHRAAESDQVLADMLAQVVTYYYLKKPSPK